MTYSIFIGRTLFVIYIMCVFSIVNTNANIINPVLLNLMIHSIQILVLVFVFIKFVLSQNLLVDKVLLFGILICFLLFLNLRNIAGFSQSRWYFIPLLMISMLHLLDMKNIYKFFLFRIYYIFYSSLLVFVLLFFSQTVDVRIIKTASFVGYGLLGASLFSVLFVFIMFTIYFHKIQNRVLSIISAISVLFSLYLILQTGVKTFFFAGFFWISILFLKVLLFNRSMKTKVSILLSILMVFLIGIKFVSGRLLETFENLFNLLLSAKFLTVSGRLPSFFSDETSSYSSLHINSTSVADYWLRLIWNNIWGHGWGASYGENLQSSTNTLPAFDGAVWEVGYSSGLFAMIGFILFFTYLLNRVRIYNKFKRTAYSFNIFIFSIFFNIFILVGAPFNGLMLPFIYCVVVSYVLKDDRRNYGLLMK